ncbi:uncharacterized protein [Narcine bancroftii]|uniref:uncharacterized protein isoform X2 n=1 Tax=Narcine bancroftii TaxID=1343680 RepID=UPI0038313332
MDEQAQSPRVTSSEGSDSPGSAGISVEPSAPLPSAPLPSCASTSEPVTPLPLPPVSSQPWAKAVDTPSAPLDHTPPSAVLRPSEEAALSDTEKEFLGATVIRGMGGPQQVGSGSEVGMPLRGTVAGSYSWMSQPGLLFGKEEDSPAPANAGKHHQMELGAGKDQTKMEVTRSDPSSVDSSQEEDSLEKLTPDSPFELLAEIQDKGPREEGHLRPSPASAGVQGPFFFTGGMDGRPSGESTCGNGSKLGVVPLGPQVQGEAGLKTRDAKPNFPLGDQPEVQEDSGTGGSQRVEEHGGQCIKAEAVESLPKGVVIKSVQSSPSGTVPSPCGLQYKGVSNLEANLLQNSSDMETGPVTIPTGEVQLLRRVYSKPPIMDKPEVILTHTPGAKTPIDRGNEAHAPSPEMPTKHPKDGSSSEEELKTPSFLRHTPRCVEESDSDQGAPRAAAVTAAAVLDHVPPEALSVDSKGSGIALLEGPLGHNPLVQKEKVEPKVMSHFGELQNVVLDSMINSAEIAQERGICSRGDEMIRPTTQNDKETKNHPEDFNSSKMEEEIQPGLVGAPQEIQPRVAGAPQEEIQPGGPPETMTRTQAMRWSHRDVESPAPEVLPPLPMADHLPSKYQQPAVDRACRQQSKTSPVSSPVPLRPDLPALDKAAPLPSTSPDLGPREEAQELAVELGDTSAPLQEMIRRSEIQRGQLSREKQVLPPPPTPGGAPVQSVVTRSTPTLAETTSTVLKPEPLSLAEDEASDLQVEDTVGQFPLTQETRLTAVPFGGPLLGRGQEVDPAAKEGGGVGPGEMSPLSPQDWTVSDPALPEAYPTDSGQREREPPEAVVGGEDAERLSRTTVKDLVYWSDPKKTGAVFGLTLTLLVSLAVFSVVSVLAYLVLALLSVTISFRIYKSVIQAVQKTNDGNPFRVYLEQDISLSADTFRKYCDTALAHVNYALKYLLQLFLVQDLVDSLKLVVLMWLMTYVGAVFNGLTLLILVVLLTFSIPAVYKKYQTEIDHYVDLVQKQVSCMVGKIQEKLPGTKRKNE